MQICLLPLRGGRVGLLFSVCKGKQLYSESNRFWGYWSNKFCKCLCNCLFYREIYRSLPRPLRKEGSAYGHTRGKGWALYLIVFCKILANLHSPPFGGAGGGFSSPFGEAGGGCRGWVGLFYSQSQNHNHKITKRIFNV